VPQGEGRPNRQAFGRSTCLSEWPAEYTTLLLRMFGIYGVAFSLLAIAIAAKSFQSWRAVGMVAAAGRGNTIAFGAPMSTTGSCEPSDGSSCRRARSRAAS
jgi:hypothetical protein